MANPGVSIITCTKRAECLNRLLANFNRQKYDNKELIIILNNDSLKLPLYLNAAKKYRNVRVYSKPERMSLGSCLNFGVQVSRFSYIAKFDDDDYYAPGYLAEGMRAMINKGADIVGKRAHFMQIHGHHTVLSRYGNMANREVSIVQGATLLVNRRVFRHIRFPDRNRSECVAFCAAGAREGFRIYSTSPYNFLAQRRRNSRNHTWIISDNELMTRNARPFTVPNIRAFVSRG